MDYDSDGRLDPARAVDGIASTAADQIPLERADTLSFGGAVFCDSPTDMTAFPAAQAFEPIRSLRVMRQAPELWRKTVVPKQS